MTAEADAVTWDLLDPAFYADIDAMHQAFTWMRANAPMWHDEANGVWAVTRHADLIEAERRSEIFRSGLGYRSFHSPGEDNMIAQDDPRHLEQRRLINRRFTPHGVQAYGPLIRRVTEELVDQFLPDGRLEVVTQLAAALPAKLTAHLLGFPEETWPQIRTWSERLMRYDQVARDPAVAVEFVTAITEFNDVLTEVAAARRADPADDLISAWVGGEVGGCPLSHDTLINETGLVISGGAETTRTVIARSLATFAEHPDQWEAMGADPALVPGAVEEMIRWVTPLNNFFRTCTADATLGGVDLHVGDRVMLAYPSANRDEAVFTEPFRFDIRRTPNPHVAFGQGTHFCLGASLARLELRLLFEVLTSRMTDLRVVEAMDIEPNIFVGAVRSLHMAFAPR
jgi:cytochrome P450 family 142 subfamily A polypeptide 1